MPSLIDLRRRIRAVKSTQQITKAMKTVAASRLRRAQDRIVGARPFAKLMGRVLNDLAERVDTAAHPLLAPPVAPDAPALVFVVTADKGLCGSFNANILRRAAGFVGDADRPVVMGLVGRKGRDFFVRRGFDVRFELVNIFNDLRYSHAQAVAHAAIEEYTGGAASRVDVIYNEFKSVIQQPVVVEQLLPIPRIGLRGRRPGGRRDQRVPLRAGAGARSSAASCRGTSRRRSSGRSSSRRRRSTRRG